MVLVAVFIAQFLYVFLRAFQQRNNVFNNWLAIIPTSYGMALLELVKLYFGVTQVAEGDIWGLAQFCLGWGTGGWLGAWLGMWLHNRIFRK